MISFLVELRTVTLDIDSQFRMRGGSGAHFHTMMDRRFSGVVGARIMNAIIPYTFNAIAEGSDTLTLDLYNTVATPGKPDLRQYPIVLPHGNYTGKKLAKVLARAVNNAYVANGGTPIGGGVMVVEIGYNVSTHKFTVTHVHGYNVGVFLTHFPNPPWQVGSESGLEIILGMNDSGQTYNRTAWGLSTIAPHPDGATFPLPARLIGRTNQLYITSPTLYDSSDFSINSQSLRDIGIMAKVPLPVADDSNISIEYLPTESQMYTFTYAVPRSFDMLEFIIYRKFIMDDESHAYEIIDFGGKNVNITVELSLLPG